MPDGVWGWVAGPFLGGCIGYWLKGFEAQRSETQARLDEIVKELQAVVAAAQKYWNKPRQIPTDQSPFLEAEAEMIGRLHWANAIIVHTRDALLPEDYNRLSELLIDIRKKATGGRAFAEPERAAEPERLQGLFVSTGRFVSEIRGIGRRCFTARFIARKTLHDLSETLKDLPGPSRRATKPTKPGGKNGRSSGRKK